MASSVQPSREIPQEEPIEEIPQVSEEPVQTAQESSLATILQQLIIIFAIALITFSLVTLYLRRQLKR